MTKITKNENLLIKTKIVQRSFITYIHANNYTK